VRDLVEKYRSEFPATTWNTYFWHPPYSRPYILQRYDHVSVDVWGRGGRGYALSNTAGRRVLGRMMADPTPPNLWWLIYWGRMWVAGEGWQAAPPGPPDSDPLHFKHLHATFL
jgi:hypothetical protein